jgi:starch synthase
VLQVASEAAPFAKTGGLADVAGSLPAALERIGCSCTLVMPRITSFGICFCLNA